MKSKALILLSTLVMALALMAQTASQTAPSTDNAAKASACCNHDQANGKTACCGQASKCNMKEGECCKGKDGKGCAMMSKDAGGKGTCCTGDQCSMMSKKDGKGCCGPNKCARPQTGA